MTSGNPSLRDALSLAVTLGCTVVKVHKTGEVRVSNPSWRRPQTINGRRSDTPKRLLGLLRNLEKEKQWTRNV